MRYIYEIDAVVYEELRENEVVGSRFGAGCSNDLPVDLFDLLIRDTAEVREVEWMLWLTQVRGLLRINSIRVDPEWIESKEFTADLRKLFRRLRVFPVCENSGAALCASLSKDLETRRQIEEAVNQRAVLLAPSVPEIGSFYRYYRD